MISVKMLIILAIAVLPGQRGYAQENTAASQAPDSTEVTDVITEFSRDASVYESNGKRDPFTSLVPKEAEEGKKIKGLLDFESAKLSGVVKTDSDKYALVIDRDGFGHVLREGYMVYGGYVTAITDNSVYLHIVKYGRALSIILSLESSKATVIDDENGEMVVKKPGINITFSQSPELQKRIGIEDVVLPSLKTVTVEEKWSGKKAGLPTIEKKPDDTKEDAVKTFSLYNPPDDSWIKLPFEIDWTNYSDETVTYVLTISDESDFRSPFILREEINESSYTLIEDMELPLNKKLYWKVVAIDDAGNVQPGRQQYLSFKISGNE